MRPAVLLALALAFTLVLGLPFSPVETEKLLPIRTLQVACQDNGITLVSEVGTGHGPDFAAAVADLRAGAPGQVFFDTAGHVLFCDGEAQAQALASGLLRPAARVYRIPALREPEGLAELLEAHPGNCTVAQLQHSNH